MFFLLSVILCFWKPCEIDSIFYERFSRVTVIYHKGNYDNQLTIFFMNSLNVKIL